MTASGDPVESLGVRRSRCVRKAVFRVLRDALDVPYHA